MSKLKYAKDFQCVNCANPAVAFFPVCDPDIPSYPYCRKCIDESKKRIMIGILEIDQRK